jgi:epsilon-lactone hydrolase
MTWFPWDRRYFNLMNTRHDGHRQTPDGIELRHLRAFVAVADELSFSRAADRLYLTQPRLSRQIRTLEKLVGCELLRRNTHNVELTVAGEGLLASTWQLLAGLDEAVTEARASAVNWTPAWAGSGHRSRALYDSHADLHDLRSEFETMCAHMPIPPEVEIHPVNASGVAGLVLTPPTADGTTILYAHGGHGARIGIRIPRPRGRAGAGRRRGNRRPRVPARARAPVSASG